jgi:Ni/Co efflux regulator RcnB
VATPAAAQRWDREDRWDRGDRDGRWDRRDRDRDGRWDGRERRRHHRHHDRWDDRRYNGYWYNNRWAYGPPPPTYWDDPRFRPGYSSWRRGAYLPGYYRTYVVDDYYRYRLRRPPRGYHWVRVNNDYLLVAIATGLIFDIIGNSRY